MLKTAFEALTPVRQRAYICIFLRLSNPRHGKHEEKPIAGRLSP
ncbi:protein of unknown function [Kyrpidia spormannii]|uniref:Uncharacterized protein n=1 Tax=Kyrpidia spormannii TaxID=2055160 RepID=A0A6F9E6X7_9BACL|nr:protein of unknown function [Kyrpidia spormannii]